MNAVAADYFCKSNNCLGGTSTDRLHNQINSFWRIYGQLTCIHYRSFNFTCTDCMLDAVAGWWWAAGTVEL